MSCTASASQPEESLAQCPSIDGLRYTPGRVDLGGNGSWEVGNLLPLLFHFSETRNLLTFPTPASQERFFRRTEGVVRQSTEDTPNLRAEPHPE